MDTFDIPVDNMLEEFESHLSDGNNENTRILFSGPFGSGKTFFLKRFFKEHQNKYRAFHLYPVNYQISSNQDILKLLKYDILLKLIEHDLINNEKDVPHLQSMKRFMEGNGKDVALDFLESLPHIGGYITAAQKLKTFAKEYQKDREQDSEQNYVQSIIDQIQNEEGSAYELDALTTFISEKLSANNEAATKNVLIIDDMDRIDPEHIFRILNLLTAHIDNTHYSGIHQKNKFGFDKIIIVCDVENIRKIFHERYGQDVNFSGYIDKFYSKTIFKYNIRDKIKEGITQIMKPYFDHNIRNDKEIEFLKEICLPILEKFIVDGVVQIRELEKLFNNPIKRINEFSNIFPPLLVHAKSFNYFLLTGFFLHIFNHDTKKLAEALDFCAETPAVNPKINGANLGKGYILGIFLPIIKHSEIFSSNKNKIDFSIGDEVFHFKVASNEEAQGSNTYRTQFINGETHEKIPSPEVKVKEQTIFKAWRQALKVSHNI